MERTIIYCGAEAREQWPGLAEPWRLLYPQLFDEDDARLARSQKRNHFAEWFAAIHLFHRDGVFYLIEKYHCSSHQVKAERVNQLGAEVPRVLRAIRRELHVQPPDLLLYTQAGLTGFAEVKGPGDRREPSERQLRSYDEIERCLGVRTELVEVRLASGAG